MRRQVLAAAAAIAAAIALGGSLGAGSGPPGGALRSGVTSLRFDAEILGDLGIALVDVAQTSAPLREGALGFALDAPQSRAVLDAAGAGFEGFAAADLHHAGGFVLQWNDARVSLAGFRLQEATAPHALELRDAEGRRWLIVDKPHAVRSSNELSLANADLLIAPELAAWLGRPELSGSYIGTLDAQLSFDPAQPHATSAAPDGGSCVGDFTQPVDLLMLTLTGMTQAAREPGGRVAMAPSATVRNLGPGDVRWYKSIAPASPVGPHPFLLLNFYRLSGGVLEQIGRGDVKHTFFAQNSGGCGCPGGHILYAGCNDLYGVTTNLDRTNLAPRSEIDALAVAWTSLGSHFDALPVDDFRDHGGDPAHDSFQHRLVVMEPDLQTEGARYFYDGWYLAPNDSNLENSLGRREVAPALVGSTWSFPLVDSGMANGSILDVLVDPQNVQPGQATELLDTGEGRVQLAAVTTDLGGGSFHYEYALMNFDVERQIQSFSLAIGAGQTVSNTGFDDGDADPLNDWTASIANGRVTWTAPAGNALEWGTLFNFRIDANASPVQSTATLTPLQAGSPGAVPIQTLPEPEVGWSIGASLAVVALLGRLRHSAGGRRAARPSRVVGIAGNGVKRKVAAVITRDRRIISTGYNGTPRGTLDCNEGGCPRCNSFAEGGTRLGQFLCSHGEENAITQAAYHGLLVKGGTLYTTFSPCLICIKMIVNAGLTEVVCNADYPLAQTARDRLGEAGVKVRKLYVAGA